MPQGLRRHPCRGVRITPAERKEAAAYESKANGGGHCTGDGRGRADHRLQRMFVRDEMGERARCRGDRHEHEKPQSSEAARQCAAEWQQPEHVEADMAETGM